MCSMSLVGHRRQLLAFSNLVISRRFLDEIGKEMCKNVIRICVGRDENKSSCPRAAILKTEEALGGREHVVCRHLEFEGIRKHFQYV